jgi:hypothetical protein
MSSPKQLKITPSTLTIPSLSWLRILDVIKDNLWYRGGATGDSPYIPDSPSFSDLLRSYKHMGLVKYLRNFNKKTASNEWEKYLFMPRVENSLGNLVPNVHYKPSQTSYWTIDGPSVVSSIYFMLSWLEIVLDFSDRLTTSLLDQDLLVTFEYLIQLSPLSFVSYAKYMTALPLALYLEQDDLPAEPVGFNRAFEFFLSSPTFYKWFTQRIRSKNVKNLSFFWSLLQGWKRATATVPESFIHVTLEKHRRSLLKPTRATEIKKNFSTGMHTWSAIDEFVDFKTQFSKKILIISRKFYFDIDSLNNVFEPSTSSCLELKRRSGGQRMHIGQLLGLQSEHPELFSPWTKSVGTKKSLGSIPDKGELVKMISTTDGQQIPFYGAPKPHDFQERLLSAARLDTWEYECLEATIVPIVEPLKVRVISKGPGATYYLAKQCQIAMWSYLKEFNQFRLIGEVLTTSHLSDLIMRESLLTQYVIQKVSSPEFLKHNNPMVRQVFLEYKEDEYFSSGFDSWVSGDYSAATDGLDGDFTMECFDSLVDAALSKIGIENPHFHSRASEYFHLVRYTLDKHILSYEPEFGLDKPDDLEQFRVEPSEEGDVLSYKQQTGQLMGSPLSFPILCYINVVVYWIALENYYGIYIPFHLLPVLVNGDDILFRANASFYDIWKSLLKEVGFSLSLGKNYLHKDVLTVNSLLFRFSNPPVPGRPAHSFAFPPVNLRSMSFKTVEFFNSGLLMAQSKGHMREKDRKLPFDQIYKRVMDGAHNKVRAHKRFIHYNCERISELTDKGRFNLFAPVFHGGLGFPIYPEVAPLIEFTSFQRRWAAYLREQNAASFEIGELPDSACALVVKKEFRVDTQAVKVKKYWRPIISAPFGPLEKDMIEYKFEEYTSSALTTGFRQTINYFRQKDDGSTLEYRLPPTYLTRDFQKSQKTKFLEYDRLSTEELLNSPSERFVFRTSR